MARPLRIEYEGALYHITSRGNARERIFWEDSDRVVFLKVLTDTVKRFGWLVHAYCLMDNHYHLIVETPQVNLSAGMRQLNGIFTQRINRRYKRCGHLLQGRFKAMLIEKDSYLLEAARYIVLNPVRAGICVKPGAWKWSSYRPTAGLAAPPDFLVTDWILQRFSRRRRDAQKKYAEFVAEGIMAENPFGARVGGLVIGSEDFIRNIRAMLQKRELAAEHPMRERAHARPPLEDLFSVYRKEEAANAENADDADDNEGKIVSVRRETSGPVSAKERRERDMMIRAAVNVHGYKLAEVGGFLGLHYTTVSRIASGKE